MKGKSFKLFIYIVVMLPIQVIFINPFKIFMLKRKLRRLNDENKSLRMEQHGLRARMEP